MNHMEIIFEKCMSVICKIFKNEEINLINLNDSYNSIKNSVGVYFF